MQNDQNYVNLKPHLMWLMLLVTTGALNENDNLFRHGYALYFQGPHHFERK